MKNNNNNNWENLKEELNVVSTIFECYIILKYAFVSFLDKKK